MDQLIESLFSLNWQTIVGMFVIVWYFTKDIKDEIKSMHEDLKIMNTRIARVEGTVYGNQVYKTLDKE